MSNFNSSQRITFFFFNDTATTEIYTLSLHDALPIFGNREAEAGAAVAARGGTVGLGERLEESGLHLGRDAGQTLPGDRKSTRLNSSHQIISYAVFCLKKKLKPHK